MAGFFHNMVKFVQTKYSGMQAEKPFFEDVQQRAERYFEDRILLLKLQATEKVALVSPKLVVGLVVGVLCFVILLIATFLLGYFLTIQLDSVFAGFGIVLGIYILLLVLTLVLYKKYLKKYIADLVVKMIYSNSNQEVQDGR